MQTIEKGHDKIKKICAVLREETLEPAHKEAHEIIAQAKQKADKIIKDAEKVAENLVADAKANMQQENSTCRSSLQLACKQSLASLRQEIENLFFNDKIAAVIEKGVQDPQLIANLINSIIIALEKDGLNVNLNAFVAKTIDARKVNELLLHESLNSIKDKSVSLGNFNAGVQLKLNDKNLTIDISEEALKELLSGHIVRKDFRKMVFDC